MKDSNGDMAKVEIRHPEAWSLVVRISSDKLTYAASSNTDGGSLLFGDLEFSGMVGGSDLKELESAVYDNDFLFGDYARRTFLMESPHFLLVPDEFSKEGDADECGRYYKYIYPGDDASLYVDRISDAAMSVVYGIDIHVDRFLRRTFDNPEVMHMLTPMIRYFRKKRSFDAVGKMLVYLRDDVVEIIAMNGSKVIFANYFKSGGNSDNAFYYVMNAWNANGMNAESDELHVLGDHGCKDLRMELTERLKDYIRNTIQVIFPAQLLHFGKDAMSAPFDLIVLPLCE